MAMYPSGLRGLSAKQLFISSNLIMAYLFIYYGGFMKKIRDDFVKIICPENFMDWVLSKICKIKFRVKNFISQLPWFKIIFRDHDYSSVFLIRIMIFKLEKMEKYFRNTEIIENGSLYADQILECLCHLKYCEMYLSGIDVLPDNGIFDAETFYRYNMIEFCNKFVKYHYHWWD